MNRQSIVLSALLLAAACSSHHAGNAGCSQSGSSSGATAGSISGTTNGTSGSGSSTTTGTSGEGTPDAQAFCAAELSDFCHLYQACGIFDPAMNCDEPQQALRTLCRPSFDAFDSSAGTSCLASLAAALDAGDCSALPAAGRSGTPTAVCDLVFKPAVDIGGACHQNLDCKGSEDGGVNCIVPFGSCSGTCEVPAPNGASCLNGEPCVDGYCELRTGLCRAFVAEGGDCSLDGWPSCAPNDYCTVGTANVICVPRGGDGSPCDFMHPCSARDACLGSSDGGSQGTCVPGVADGAACVADGHGGSNCLQGSYCVSGLCSAAPAGLGKGCSVAAYCREGLVCSNPDGGDGVCRNFAKLNDPCASDFDCDSRFVCTNGACATLPTNGQPCLTNTHSPCMSGDFCDAQSLCRPPGNVGANCAGTNSGCADGYCDPTGHCAAWTPVGGSCSPYQELCVDRSPYLDGNGLMDASCQAIADGGDVCVPDCW